MKKHVFITLLLWAILQPVFSQDIKLTTQFINPCGNDGSNEFIVAQTLGNTVNVGNLAFSSAVNPSNPTNFNWYWYGKNVVTTPYPTFSSLTPETCGNAGTSLACFRLLDPGTPADATIINTQIATLNTIAGCNVFLAVPASGDIPPNSNVIIFLGAAGCGFDTPNSNLNFSNHCSGATPITQYFIIVGNAAYSPLSGCTGGYFSNSALRTSTIYNYTGGGNTVAANYQTNSSVYTPGAAPSPSATNAGVMVPNGLGGSKWVNNQGCIPQPAIILPDILFQFDVVKHVNNVALNWEFTATEPIKEFIVEKSSDNTLYKAIKYIAVGPHAQGDILKETFTDLSDLSRNTFYRIKAIAENRKVFYSSVKVIGNDVMINARVFPNPAGNEIHISSYINKQIKFDIISTNGNKLLSGNMLNETNRYNIQHFPHGVYVIRVFSHNGTLLNSVKFLKQ